VDRNRPRPTRSTLGSSRRRARGFTLIELLIVVAIIGIIGAIAAPSYSAYVTQTRRVDATIFLTEIAGEQQRYFSDRNAYAGTMAELGYADALSEEGYYSVAIALDAATNRNFTLTATPVAGEAQASDEGCTTFTLTARGARDATGTEGREGCW